MKTVARHALNDDPSAREIWEDWGAGKTIYAVGKIFVACFWGGPGPIVYAEQAFDTQAKAQEACEAMRRGQQDVDPAERWALSRPEPGQPVMYRGAVVGAVGRIDGACCWLRHDENDSGAVSFQWALREGVNPLFGWPSKRTEDSIPGKQF